MKIKVVILNKCLKVKSRNEVRLITYTRALEGYEDISILNEVDNIIKGL